MKIAKERYDDKLRNNLQFSKIYPPMDNGSPVK